MNLHMLARMYDVISVKKKEEATIDDITMTKCCMIVTGFEGCMESHCWDNVLIIWRSWTNGSVRLVYKHLINQDWGRLTTGRSPYWSIRVSM